MTQSGVVIQLTGVTLASTVGTSIFGSVIGVGAGHVGANIDGLGNVLAGKKQGGDDSDSNSDDDMTEEEKKEAIRAWGRREEQKRKRCGPHRTEKNYC